MVSHEDLEGKARPRGRPFQKGHTIRRKPKNEIADSTGYSIGNEGGVVAPALESAIVEPENDGIFHQLPKLVVETINHNLKETMETTQEKPQVEETPLTLIEEMEFTNGNNKLSIRFSKKNNRMFNIKIFLNDDNEIRPVTYNGSSTAYGFWNLLKKSLKT